MNVLGHFNYWIVIILMMVGFYTIISRSHLVKKLIGLSIFQTAVFILYVSAGKIIGGTAPILIGDYGNGSGSAPVIYSHPLPHVLILTAIVVGIATTALGLALVVRIHEAYGTVDEDEIHMQEESL